MEREERMVTTATGFDETVRVTLRAAAEVPVGPGAVSTYDVVLAENWASLRGVHGGFMTALAVRAAEAAAPGRALRTITTSFLRPADVGEAVIEAEVVRHGRSLTTIATRLRQGGRTVTTSRATLLAASADAPEREWSEKVTDRPAPRDLCVSFTPPPMIRHFDNAELLVDPATIPLSDGSDARVAGHVRPRDGREIDAAWLVMIGDWFPPSPFRRFEPPIGGVSIDYTVHVHRTPTRDGEHTTTPWIEGVFVASDGCDGIALERGVLSDAEGFRLAETFHTRWTG
jgi:acyl-CoA thioesterase